MAMVGAAMRYECELEGFQMRDSFYCDVINRRWYYQFLNIIIFIMWWQGTIICDNSIIKCGVGIIKCNTKLRYNQCNVRYHYIWCKVPSYVILVLDTINMMKVLSYVKWIKI